MRILHCIPALEPGGAERQLVLLSRTLPALGWDFHVAALAGGNFVPKLHPSTSLHLIENSGSRDPRVAMRLMRLIDKLGPSVLQTWLMQMDVLGGFAAAARSVPWVATERNSAAAYPSRWSTRLRSLMVRRADALVANSDGGLQFWLRASSRQRRLVIRNAVAEEFTTSDAALPDGVALPDDAKLIVCTGRLVEEKRASTVLRALARMRQELPVVAIFCGTGPYEAELRAEAQRAGVGDAAVFAGFVSNVAAVMCRADVFVSMSRYEGSPNAVQEAMACGTPVVVSDIPAHRELVDESCARLVDGDDDAALAAAVIDTLRDREAASLRAARGRETALSLSPRAMAEAYDGVYRDVLRARGRALQ